MADDDKGAKPTDPLAADPLAAAPLAGEPVAASEGETVPRSEWTASDRRGPLDSADDAERYVPAHEMDAEGGLDPQAAPGAAGGHGAAGANDTPAAQPTDHAAAPPPARRASLVPVGLGLVVGALVGAGSAWLVYSQTGGNHSDGGQVAALASRVDALEKRPTEQAAVAKLGGDLDALRGKVATLDKQVSAVPAPAANGQGAKEPAPAAVASEQGTKEPAPAPADAALGSKVAALGAALDELRTRTSALQAQDAKETGATDKVAALQTDLADTRKSAADARSGLQALKSEQDEIGRKVAGLTIAVAGALKKAETAQTDVEGVQGRQKTLEGKLGSPALAVVADSLVQQIVAGQPFSRQVDALGTLGADPAKVAVLQGDAAKGVASAPVLLAKWKPLENPVIAVGNKAPANANLGQRLEHGLFGLVSVRRADEANGSDLASRVNRISSDLAHDDVPGAYAGWQALPADARSKSEDWGALAKASAGALATARDLQRSAIDALGAKKS